MYSSNLLMSCCLICSYSILFHTPLTDEHRRPLLDPHLSRAIHSSTDLRSMCSALRAPAAARRQPASRPRAPKSGLKSLERREKGREVLGAVAADLGYSFPRGASTFGPHANALPGLQFAMKILGQKRWVDVSKNSKVLPRHCQGTAKRPGQVEDALRPGADHAHRRAPQFGEVGRHVHGIAPVHAANAPGDEDRNARLVSEDHRTGDCGGSILAISCHFMPFMITYTSLDSSTDHRVRESTSPRSSFTRSQLACFFARTRAMSRRLTCHIRRARQRSRVANLHWLRSGLLAL